MRSPTQLFPDKFNGGFTVQVNSDQPTGNWSTSQANASELTPEVFDLLGAEGFVLPASNKRCFARFPRSTREQWEPFKRRKIVPPVAGLHKSTHSSPPQREIG
jgi:hypothetical protein